MEACRGCRGTGRFDLSWVFRQWIAAVRAEAAVLARASDARVLIEVATDVAAGNPVASAIAARAAALERGDRSACAGLAEAFDGCGATYQAERTRVLCGRL